LYSALLAGAAIALTSCRERAPAGPDVQVPALQASTGYLSGGMLYCRPLPYDSVTALIGGGGGTIQVGKHTLSIPPGALSGPVSITAVAPVDSVNRVLFRPEGLVFKKPVTLTMAYMNCDIGSSMLRQVAYANDSLQILEYEPSVDDAPGKRVTAQLIHFSLYAVSY
jgi:hypothetical protein